MQILIIFIFILMESKITRGHNLTLMMDQFKLDLRKYSFSQRSISTNGINI